MFPTNIIGGFDPHETAAMNTFDAHHILDNKKNSEAWTSVLKILAECIQTQRTCEVMPPIYHGRVNIFISQWNDDELFALAVREKPNFAKALKLFQTACDNTS